MASISKHGSKYQVQVFLGRDGEGKRVRKTITVPSRKIAKQIAKEEEEKVSAGVREEDQPTGLVLDRWLESLTVKPRTVEHYRMCVEKARPHLGHVPLSDLKPLHIDLCLAALAKAGASDRMRQMVCIALGVAFSWAVRKRLLLRSPMEGVDRPRVQKKDIHPWTEEEARQFLEACPDPLFRVAIGTGLRIGELLGLRWEDVNWQTRELRVERTLHKDGSTAPCKTERSRRRISLPASVTAALNRQREANLAKGQASSPWVFVTSTGTPLSEFNVRRSFARACKKAGVRAVRMHDLRHTHATLLIAKGVDPRTVSGRLGHSSVSFTLDVYAHFVKAADEKAAQAAEAIFG